MFNGFVHHSQANLYPTVMRLIAILLVSALSAAPGSNGSQPPNDGSALLRSCGAAVRLSDGARLSDAETVQAVHCAGYVSGFLDALALLRWKGGATPVCVPAAGIENDQAARIVVKYLRQHPERLHESGRILLITAIAEAFPCKG